MNTTMDYPNETALQFLDLQDLNENEKDNLISIIKKHSITKAVQLPWTISDKNNSTSDFVTTEIPNEHFCYNAIPTFSNGHLMTQMCNDWMPMYNVSSNGHYVSGMAYPHSGYNFGSEIQNVNYGKENRSGRNRNGRRNYNQTLNPANEMQLAYIGEQTQFHPQPQILYYTYDHSPYEHSAQQSSVASGQIYPSHYPPQMYPSIHTNTHIISSHPHPTYHEYHQSPSVPSQNTFVQSVPPQTTLVEGQIDESYNEQCVQSTYTSDEPVCDQQVNNSNNDSTQINIVDVTNTMNNSTQQKLSPMKNLNNNTKIIKMVTPVVMPKNGICNGGIVQKIEASCTNKIEIDQNIDKIVKSEISTNDETTIVKNPLVDMEGNENLQIPKISESKNENKNVKIQNNSSITPNDSSLASTCEMSKPKKLYASLFKVSDTEMSSSCKTIACTEDTAIKQNESLIQNQTSSIDTKTENGLSNINGMVQNHYDPNVFRIGELLSNYKIEKNVVSLIPRGLINRSNYCYVNSILQALLACSPFHNLFMTISVPEDVNWNNSLPLITNMTKFIREFMPMTKAARLSRKDRVKNNKEDNAVADIQTGIAFDPTIYNLSQNMTASIFSQDGQQEDAEEFLSYLLNGINDEMLELMRLSNNEKKKSSNENGNEEWQVMKSKNKSTITRRTELGRTPLSDIFQGQMRTKISRTGQQPTENIQPFYTLQLDVDKAESVRSAFELLVGRDQLEGIRCSKTKKQIEAWKQVTLEELPIILILHLKWFNYNCDRYNGCTKILKNLNFPVNLKIDGKFLSPNTMKKLNPKQKQYKLFAVTYHDGKEASKGHYVTDAFHVGYGSWLRYDDSTIKCVLESNVLKPVSPRVPYLLYYRRCDTIGNKSDSLNNEI